MRRGTRSSTRSQTGSLRSEAVPPGLDEECSVSLGDVRRDHDRQRPYPLGFATAVPQSTHQLAGLLWIVQEDVHGRVIDSPHWRLDYRSG